VVRSLLERAGLDENDLQCPLDWPLDSASRHAAAEPSRVTMNCSGKHAAFLFACVHNGWPTDTYLEQDHPLQQLIRSTVEEFTGEPIGRTGVDGCGAPVFATTLRGLATGVAKACASTDPAAVRLVRAILADPWAISGPGRPNTVVAEQLGLVTKGGAEGVIIMAAPGGAAVALKMVDGSGRATTLVALRLLASVGAISEDEAVRVSGLTTDRVLGGGVPVGSIRVSELVTQI
jgi:L-asparaginase II